jgi:hypothetical protein
LSKRAFAPSRSTSITPKSGTSREQVLEFQYPPDAEERGHVPLQHLVYDVVAQELLSLRNALQQRAGTPVQTMKPNFLLPGVVLSLAGLSLVASAADISGKVMTRGMQPLALATVTACWGSSKERITSTNQTVTDADGEYTLSIEAEGVFVELTYAEKRHRPAFWRTNLHRLEPYTPRS